jgi:hypothetical protein
MSPKSVQRARFQASLVLGSLVLSGGFADAKTGQSEIAVVGPLEQLDCSRGTLQILGISVQLINKRIYCHLLC